MFSITKSEASDLKRLEGVVSRGKKAFIEVGTALKEIRDRKLYKATHRSFAAYVEERFGFKRTYAHNLIESSEAVKSVQNSEQIENPGQAVELAKAAPEQREAVLQEAVKSSGGKPTAKDIATARSKIVQGSLVDDDCCDDDDYEDVSDVDEEEGTPVLVSSILDLFVNASNRMQLLRAIFDELEDWEVATLSDWINQ